MNQFQFHAAPAIRFAVEAVGPQEAANFLASSTGNRPVRKKTVNQMSIDMLEGRWLLTHQGIAIAPSGRLLDGQHRMLAVVKAGVPIPMTVARDVSPEAFAVMDGAGISAGKRSLKDVLGGDSRILDPCSYIARLHNKQSQVTPFHVSPVLAHVAPHVAALVKACGTVVRSRTAASIKAAAALRLMQGNHDDYVLTQWTALVMLDYPAMSPAIQAFCRQLTDAKHAAEGSTVANDRAARAWIAFDWSRRNVTRIQINSVAQQMEEMRAVWRPDWI